MQANLVPASLRDRLGLEATNALLELLDKACDEWSEPMLTKEVFERRMAEEFAKIRVEMAQLRTELLKWSFVFWIGQVVATASIMGFMLRFVGAGK